jgi:hypothetical protein
MLILKENVITFRTIMLISIISMISLLSIYGSSVNAEEIVNVTGGGLSELPGGVITLFGFNATESKGKAFGQFECFAVMPDGKTMYVNGTVTDIVIYSNNNSATITGPTIVTGFGAGNGTFNAIVNENGGGNDTLLLTTDVNGDGIQASSPDGSEGPFNEKIIKGFIRINP